MAGKGLVAVVMIVLIVVFAFLTISAQGTASAPTGKISAVPNPGQSGTVQITLETQAYSLVAPNSIYQLGGKFIYSVWQTSATGGLTAIQQNQSIASTPTSLNGSLYLLTATFSIYTTAICSGASCAATPFNITVTATAYVQTYVAFWQSAQSKIVFSNVGSFNAIPALTAPSPNSYYYELGVPITGIVAVGFLGAFGLGWRNEIVMIVGLVAIVVIPIEVFLWV